MNLSIIIPVYNEATRINKLLNYLIKNISTLKKTEIILVDGESTDNIKNTLNEFKQFHNIHFIKSKKGRGIQMNLGAKHAKGKILYFLHADSFPPTNFDKYIVDEFEKNNLAGCFKMKFDSSHWWLKLSGWFTQFNIKFFRGGDQSLFIEKQLFNKIGRFPEAHIIFEDFTLIRKLYKIKQFTVIQKWIISSSRRYQDNGIAKLQYHYWTIYLKKWCGASTESLVKYYKQNIR